MPGQFYVAAKAWVVREGRTLVVQDRNCMWDLPGGRIDDGEFARIPFHEVLRRELSEEIGLMVREADLRGISQWIRPPRAGETGAVRIFVVHFGLEAPPGFTPTLSEEHTEARWVENPLDLLPPGLIPEATSDPRG